MTNSLLIYEESGYLFNDATKRLEWFEIDKILISFTYGVVRYIGTWGGGIWYLYWYDHDDNPSMIKIERREILLLN